MEVKLWIDEHIICTVYGNLACLVFLMHTVCQRETPRLWLYNANFHNSSLPLAMKQLHLVLWNALPVINRDLRFSMLDELDYRKRIPVHFSRTLFSFCWWVIKVWNFYSYPRLFSNCIFVFHGAALGIRACIKILQLKETREGWDF